MLVRTNQQDLHRLRCNSFADALRAAFLARHGHQAARIILGMSPTAPATRTVRAGIERLLDDDRCAARRQRAWRWSRTRRRSTPLPPRRRSPRRRSRHRAGRALRPAARLPFRSAGQHDRDAARARTRGGASRSTRSTARRASRPPRCCATSTCWSSICRTSARASTPTSTRWPTACAPPRGTASASSSATGRTRSAASPSKGRRCGRSTRRSSDSSRSRCATA